MAIILRLRMLPQMLIDATADSVGGTVHPLRIADCLLRRVFVGGEASSVTMTFVVLCLVVINPLVFVTAVVALVSCVVVITTTTTTTATAAATNAATTTAHD